MNKKQRGVLMAEAVIVFVILAAILLPQLIGTVDVVRNRGDWRTTEDLCGKTIGTAADSEWTAAARELWPDAVFQETDSVSDLPKMTVNGTIDAFMTTREEATDILLMYPELTAMLLNISTQSEIMNSAGEHPYIIIRESDYAYLSASKTLNDLNVPGTRIAGLTGTELTYYPAMIYPDSEIVNYNSFTDMFLALESGKVDAAAAYYTQLDMVSDNYGDMAYISIPPTSVT